LKPPYDDLLSNFASEFNLRRYTQAADFLNFASFTGILKADNAGDADPLLLGRAVQVDAKMTPDLHQIDPGLTSLLPRVDP